MHVRLTRVRRRHVTTAMIGLTLLTHGIAPHRTGVITLHVGVVLLLLLLLVLLLLLLRTHLGRSAILLGRRVLMHVLLAHAARARLLLVEVHALLGGDRHIALDVAA